MNKKIFVSLPTAIIGLGFIITAKATVISTKQVQVLQKIMIPETHYGIGMGIAEFAPNTSKGRHMHSSVEVGYVLEGEIVMMIEGQSLKTIKKGESFQYPAYAIHDTKAGSKGTKVLATWVFEQGKPVSLLVSK
jgi:quercetin dioxygenase-like cupin family protein